MMNMFSNANMDTSEDPNHINNIYLRYAAENFEGPPEYILQAIDENNKLIWRSDRTKAKGGMTLHYLEKIIIKIRTGKSNTSKCLAN